MAIIVVGGNGRGVGKTALVCGVIAALREFAWTAVKITNHSHGDLPALYEESAAGQGTDTGRYLAAGARRAFLMAARDPEIPQKLAEFWKIAGPDADVVFESNRILKYLRPDLCLAIGSGPDAGRKSSFGLVELHKNAVVRLGEREGMERIPALGGTELTFELPAFERISPPLLVWLRESLLRHVKVRP